MFRAVLVGLIALVASTSAFFVPVPGCSVARTARSSAPTQMVSSTSVSTPPATSAPPTDSAEAAYTATLKKMEAEAMADMEKAFAEVAIMAKAESVKIWAEFAAEFPPEAK